MAADNSPPRIQPIVITAFIAVLALVGLKFVFDSYYVQMFEAEEYRKVGSVEPTALLALRAAEKKSLASAPIPIDRAVQLVAKGRGEPMDELKDGGITPFPSNDNAALIGWATLAKPGAAVTTNAASDASAPAPSGSTAPAGSPGPSPSGAPAVAPSAAPASSAPPGSPSASPAAPPATSAKPAASSSTGAPAFVPPPAPAH
jgi:hypothetical protein